MWKSGRAGPKGPALSFWADVLRGEALTLP
jgi:hypothetical protein